MDSVIFYAAGCCLYNNKHCKTANTFADTGTSFAESLVHTSCDRIYVFVFSTRVCLSHQFSRTYQEGLFRQDARICRYFSLYGACIHDFWHAVRSIMGERCMGTFLELGSKGDMGTYYVDGVPYIYTHATISQRRSVALVYFTYICFCLSADVLVGNQLPTFCAG